MKRKEKLILILGIILFLLGIAPGPNITESKEVVGKYVTGDPDEYLDIKKDGTFYLKEKGKYSHIVGAPETTGKWKVEKGEIIFSHPLGIVTRWKIKPNVLIDEEGKTWFIEGSVPQSIRGVSKESVVGTYIDKGVDAELLIKPDGKYIYKRKGFSIFDGVWRLNGNQIKLYPFILIGSKKQKVEDPGLVMSGEIIGQVLQTTGGLRLVKQIGQPPVVQKPESSSLQTKEDLIAVLQELKDSMLFKIDIDIQNTAQAFTDVKGYWRVKRWADIARAPLRVFQGTLSLLTKVSNRSSLNEQIKQSFDRSESVTELIGVGMMIYGLKEAGEKLAYALDGPSYVSSVETMLKKADETQLPLSRFNPQPFKQVIENYLNGPENSPLIVLRKSIPPQKRTAEVLKGALRIRTIITKSFNDLISEVKSTQMTGNFPVDEIKDLQIKVLSSAKGMTKIIYTTPLENLKTEVELGAPASLYSAFGLVAGFLAQDLKVQQSAEWLGLATTAGNIIMLSITYKVPGNDPIKILQQVSLAGEIIINGRRVFQKDPEEEFYMLPQTMLHSLPVELSHLLVISDSITHYMRNLLNTSSEGIAKKAPKSQVKKQEPKPAEAPPPAPPAEPPRPAKYP